MVLCDFEEALISVAAHFLPDLSGVECLFYCDPSREHS